MVNDKFKARFWELKEELEGMPVRTRDHPPTRYIDADIWQKWATSVEALIGAACGQHSPYCKNFIRAREACNGGELAIKSLAGIFRSAKEAFDGNYLWLSCNECGQIEARSSGRRGAASAGATSELTGRGVPDRGQVRVARCRGQVRRG